MSVKYKLKRPPQPRRAQRLREFAECLGISYYSVFRAANDGRLRTIKFGRLRLVPPDEADRVLRNGL